MRTAHVILAVACVLGLLALAGCGCGKVRQAAEVARMAQDAQDGKMTVTNEKGEKATIETDKTGEKGGKVTVTTDQGTTTTEVGTTNVSEKDVGIDFYPGATVETSAAATSTGKDNAQYSAVSLTTTASFDEVAKFYKDKYAKGNALVEMPNNLMITISTGENSGKVIMVTSEEGKTKIVIHASSQ
ncbi:hypothetical protein LLH23_20810 [bacterium]|nr:hypothetical protein [bacterium]